MVKIKVRRGLDDNLPTFDEGEPGFSTDTKRVFFGSNEGNVELANKETVDLLGGRLDGIDSITVNIKSKGAIGDGVTDCTTVLQDAHDSLPNGGVIFLPPGRYNFSTLNITNKYITITGSGVLVNGTIVVGVDGFNLPFIDYHLTIDGVRFERDTESDEVNAIEFQRAYWCKIKNCYFEGYNACIYPRALDLQGNTQTHTVRIVIDGCSAEKVNYLLYVPFNISGGIYGVGDFTVTNCNPVLCKISAISARGIDGLLCTNNYFTLPINYTGTNTPNTTKAEVIYVDTAAQIVIENNQLFEAGKEGIHLHKTQFFTVVGNNIVWPGQLQYADGVRVSGGDPSGTEYCIGVIANNPITFPTRRGISIEDNSGHISITGNTIRDAGNTAHFYGTVGTNTPYGIYTDSTTKYITLSGNTPTGANSTVSLNGDFNYRQLKEQNGLTGNLALTTTFASLGTITFPKQFESIPTVQLMLNAIGSQGAVTIVPTNITATGFSISGFGSVANTITVSWRAII
jgi:hypothetical protein